MSTSRYFGRARELPGVKEMFEAASQKPREDKPLDSRADMRKQVDASYYGYNLDEEDGTLLEYEAQKEREAFENLRASSDGRPPKAWEPLPGDAGDGVAWQLPTSDEVQEELMERRRRRLLDKLG
jgi:pre-mRNA-splicing factor ISY1